jgi:serine/threonine protein kinase
MGAVYLAEHRHMQRLVALKVISPEFVSNPEAVRRFQQEVTAAARLGPHLHVVTVYDADHVGNTHFLVMEYLEGENLADYLRHTGPLPTQEACDYIRQAALGLQHAAEKGMVHRDIKPQNLMRTPAGQVKVLDFGLARLIGGAETARSQLTQQGALLGTADYMAPEQANDSRSADGRADIYSLGCTLYHLLTGRVPFPDGGPVDKIIKHAVETPTPLEVSRPDLPIGVVRLVEKMMAKAPEGRLQTAGEVADALAPWAAAGTSVPVRLITPCELPAPATLPMSGAADSFAQAGAGADDVQQKVNSSARFLLLNGWVHCVLGALLLPVGIVMAIAIQSYYGEKRVFLDDVCILLISFGLVYMLASVVVIYGAMKMKSRQSYRWAFLAAVVSGLPATLLFPITASLAIRCLLCLTNPEVKRSFASARKRC